MNDDLFLIGMGKGNDRIVHHGYHRFYPMFFEHLRDKPISLLEIGVHTLDPFNIWREYFPFAELFGIEIQHIDKDKIPPNCTIFEGDQGNLSFLEDVVDSLPNGMDIIIDDGSHVPEHQIKTFEFLFNNCLNDGGIYIIEDIETSYWRHGILYGNEINCGADHSDSVINKMKQAIDTGINVEFFGKEGGLRPVSSSVLYNIGSITFGQNCVIIVKNVYDDHMYRNREYRFKHYTQNIYTKMGDA